MYLVGGNFNFITKPRAIEKVKVVDIGMMTVGLFVSAADLLLSALAGGAADRRRHAGLRRCRRTHWHQVCTQRVPCLPETAAIHQEQRHLPAAIHQREYASR